jgi:hypothetical protein
MHCVEEYIHASNQLSLCCHRDPEYVVATYLNLKTITADEYKAFLKKTGDSLKAYNTGRLLADFSELQHFSVELNAVAINHFKSLITDRVPYLLLAIVAADEKLTQTGLALSLRLAKPLSKKFLDGQIFSKKEEALQWLVDYPVEQLLI